MEEERNPNLPNADLHRILSLATLTLVQATAAAEARLDATQQAEIKRSLAEGSGRLALFASTSGQQVHVELALIGPGVPSVFSSAILKLDGPAAAAAAPAEAVKAIDRGKLN